MTFGAHTLVDLLSWTVAILLSIKVIATIILLRRDRQTWFASRSGPALWWATEIAPILAVPMMIEVALIEHRSADAWVYAGLMVFVLVAVPIVVWRRFRQPSRYLSGAGKRRQDQGNGGS